VLAVRHLHLWQGLRVHHILRPDDAKRCGCVGRLSRTGWGHGSGGEVFVLSPWHLPQQILSKPS